ncbi:MAG: bifunctional acetate--CoA ligase family protein/GNAT family N-acetyltransferase [Hyphomicrobiaceae bacterium]|nr:bifunctional acetate--CoA ligase family protein/GNAT family N-acetyltransferase [Hyphomicrobiaceae bacterium]
MTIRNLDALLRPKAVALIGAGTRPGSVGLIMARNLLRARFKGTLRLINPKHAEIEGVPCFPSIAALPEAPDLGIVVTPPQTVPGIIAELGAKGARAAVVITAGVRGELRDRMLKAARPHLLRIQGPNCLGLMLPSLGLDASFSHEPPMAGDLAFLSQSGALITGVIDWAKSRNIGFSHVVSLGDMADADFGDLLDYLAGDVKSRAILLYMESITNAAKFMSAARRAARAKPVIVVKSGRGASGAKAALSHTGAMAGTDGGYDAAFKRAGVLRVPELRDLFTAAEILARHPALVGDRLAILTNGGGAGVLAADHLALLGGQPAPLSEETRAALDKVLPATWSRGDPVDIIGDADADRYAKALNVLLASKDADAILVMNCPTALASSEEIASAVTSVVKERRSKGFRAMPILANWLGVEASRGARQMFSTAGIATFDMPADAIDGFMDLVRHARAQEQLARMPPSLPERPAFETDKADRLLKAALAKGQTVLDEKDAKDLLVSYGIATVPTVLAHTPEEVFWSAAGFIKDYGACVVKVSSKDISHKSDVGGVRLGLTRPEEARQAAEDMLARIAIKMPRAQVEGFSVQAMINNARGLELIIGMTVDDAFGPLMMFGAGGTAVEVLRDTAYALPPLDLNLASDLMRETRVWRLMQGYRDRARVDTDAVAEALVRMSYLVARHPEIREIDINPLLADPGGAVALDARVRIADAAASPRVPMAIRPYPSEWERHMDLDDIGRVLVRPTRPEDEALYQDFFANVTLDDQRLRFFSAAPDLSHRFLARLTQIDYAREMAFVAVSKESGALLGVVHFILDPDLTEGEYAILVRSDLKGHGLGWRLMQHLIAYAEAHHVGEIQGLVLRGNRTMLDMCRNLGFKVEPDADDDKVMRVVLPLGKRRGGL